MKILGYLVLVIFALGLILLIAGQMGLLAGKMPGNLGVKDGRFKPPSKTPNSVSSQAALWPDSPQKEYATIEPFKININGEKSLEKLANILQKRERTSVISRGNDYIYAQCTTALLKYVDDVEFYWDKTAGVIHVRSSSRLGAKDFGVNRARIESIRREYEVAPS